MMSAIDLGVFFQAFDVVPVVRFVSGLHCLDVVLNRCSPTELRHTGDKSRRFVRSQWFLHDQGPWLVSGAYHRSRKVVQSLPATIYTFMTIHLMQVLDETKRVTANSIYSVNQNISTTGKLGIAELSSNGFECHGDCGGNSTDDRFISRQLQTIAWVNRCRHSSADGCSYPIRFPYRSFLPDRCK